MNKEGKKEEQKWLEHKKKKRKEKLQGGCQVLKSEERVWQGRAEAGGRGSGNGPKQHAITSL